MTRFQRARQREAGQQLLKNQRKADHAKTAPIDAVYAEFDEARRRVIAKLAQVVDRASGQLADGAKVTLEDLEILRVFLVLAECRLGPDPLADQARPDFGEHLVHLPADMSTEIHEQRERLGRKALLFEERL